MPRAREALDALALLITWQRVNKSPHARHVMEHEIGLPPEGGTWPAAIMIPRRTDRRRKVAYHGRLKRGEHDSTEGQQAVLRDRPLPVPAVRPAAAFLPARNLTPARWP